MDGKNFDELTRKLATGTSRRSVLRGLVGGGAALAAAKVGSDASAAANRVQICHQTGSPSNPYVAITVAAESAELNRHLRHGDALYGGCCNASDCPATSGECGINPTCEVDTSTNTTYCAYEQSDAACANSVACDAYDNCCEAVCNASFSCVAAGTPDETCDDGQACTSGDICGDDPGSCAGTVDCDTPGTCETGPGYCDDDGECAYDSVECNDPGYCQLSPGTCEDDVCYYEDDPDCGGGGCTSKEDCPSDKPCCCWNENAHHGQGAGTCASETGCVQSVVQYCLEV